MATRAVYPHPGPQTRALASSASELLYGGEAGGGKTRFLVLDALGGSRIELPHYKAILFRRYATDLKKSLIPESQEIYPHLNGRFNAADLVWRFPSGATIQLAHMEHDHTRLRYDGGEWQFCGFDELTHFYESQYTFMFSRLRSSHGLRTFMRATTNPGGIGHEWVLKRFAPWLYPPSYEGYKGPRAAAGEKLFYRMGPRGMEICASDWRNETCSSCSDGTSACAEHRPRSRVFIPAKLTDNPSLDGAYAAALDELDPVTRAHKKFGDWMARPEAGKVFNRDNLLPTAERSLLHRAPAQVVARVRFWDRAATADDGDWTVGVLMSVAANGVFVVEDVIARRLGPAEVAALILSTAKTDPPGTIVGLEQEPGASGKFEVSFYVRALAGFSVRSFAPDTNKVARAGPFATQVFNGNIRMVSGMWNDAYINELHAFPDGEHDDQVDASSGAFRVLSALLQAHRGGPGGITVGTVSIR